MMQAAEMPDAMKEQMAKAMQVVKNTARVQVVQEMRLQQDHCI